MLFLGNSLIDMILKNITVTKHVFLASIIEGGYFKLSGKMSLCLILIAGRKYSKR